jgi:hypothetical protein
MGSPQMIVPALAVEKPPQPVRIESRAVRASAAHHAHSVVPSSSLKYVRRPAQALSILAHRPLQQPTIAGVGKQHAGVACRRQSVTVMDRLAPLSFLEAYRCPLLPRVHRVVYGARGVPKNILTRRYTVPVHYHGQILAIVTKLAGQVSLVAME